MNHADRKEIHLAAIVLWQEHGAQHRLAVTGYSMLPLFRAGDQVQVAAQPSYAIGDVVVLQQGAQLLVHRIIAHHFDARGEATWVTQGDNCVAPDPPVAAHQILGKVTALHRGKLQCRIDSLPWRTAHVLVAFTVRRGWSRQCQRLLLRLLLRLLARLLQRQLSQTNAAHRVDQPLRPEIALLYLCTRQTLTTDQQTSIRATITHVPFDWSYVLTLAEQHGVAGLIFANLQRVGLDNTTAPASVHAALQQLTYRNIAVKTGVYAKLAAICAVCDEHAVDVMVLKGTALDQTVYAQPWYVEHDVDLLLRPRPNSPTTLSLAARVAAVDRFFWTLPGFEYEFDTHHDLTMNGLLAVDIDDLWRDAHPIEIGGQRAWVMCAEDLLLTACINACRKRFFHLKSLLAIATILNKFSDLQWDTLVTKARQYHVAAIVYSALLVAQQTVGATFPDRLAPQLHLSRLRVTLIRAIVRYLLDQELPSIPVAAKQPRPPDRFLLLPYAVYTPMQLVRKVIQLIARSYPAG